jgi:hypothetical protein
MIHQKFVNVCLKQKRNERQKQQERIEMLFVLYEKCFVL